jgi:hypothetical protein
MHEKVFVQSINCSTSSCITNSKSCNNGKLLNDNNDMKILFITCNKKYGYPDDENPIMYFYDAYNENFKLEELLKQYQRENRLKFDAIIFTIEAFKLTKGQIKALNDQENKSCLV